MLVCDENGVRRDHVVQSAKASAQRQKNALLPLRARLAAVDSTDDNPTWDDLVPASHTHNLGQLDATRQHATSTAPGAADFDELHRFLDKQKVVDAGNHWTVLRLMGLSRKTPDAGVITRPRNGCSPIVRWYRINTLGFRRANTWHSLCPMHMSSASTPDPAARRRRATPLGSRRAISNPHSAHCTSSDASSIGRPHARIQASRTAATSRQGPRAGYRRDRGTGTSNRLRRDPSAPPARSARR